MVRRVFSSAKGQELEAIARRACESALEGAPKKRVAVVVVAEGEDFGLFSLVPDRRMLIQLIKRLTVALEGN